MGLFNRQIDGRRSGGYDGKTLCGTREGGKKQLLHMVPAWAGANNLVLGQRKAGDKSNEITAIPKLLAALELSGTVVTIDAMPWAAKYLLPGRS